jgi:hypothetical protein
MHPKEKASNRLSHFSISTRGHYMNQFKLRGTLMAVAGVLAMGTVAPAMADSTSDVIYTLMAKGVLTEEEGHQLLDGRDKEQVAEKKAIKSAGKITISDAIDNATIYGDIRVRAEHRDGEDTRVPGPSVNEDRDRGRYKVTLGVKTKSGDFYSDLAFAMGAGGRSDNATFGGAKNSNGGNDKETLFVKRAMVGWKATDWLTIEAGRIANPLYTTSMVWDGDLTFEGLAEKLTFKAGDVDLFANLVQSQYLGDKKNFSNTTATTGDANNNFILAFQGGAKFKITDSVSAKAGLTYTTYTHDRAAGLVFAPTRSAGTATGYNALAINDLRTIEIPFELNIKGSGNLTYSAFGEYVHNLDGSDRAAAACGLATNASYTAADKAAVCAAGNDDNAWMLGVGIKSAGKQAAAGDWDAKLWYQSVGVYSVDPNGVDSDFMDSRVNMKGWVFKSGYNVKENVVMNFAAGHAERKDSSLAAVGTGGDIGLNIDKYNLYQLDLTYKF